MARRKELEGKPNILLIMADQFRWDYLGYMGADWVETPNLDRLARQGTVFSHCFTNSPICAPARISLASGQRPHRFGSLSNDSFLPLSAPTYYQRLRDHEYYVGCVGKLDLAKPDKYNGLNGDRPACYGWGFTHPLECEGKMHAGTSPTPIGPYSAYLESKGLLQKFHEDYQRRPSTRFGWFLNCDDSVLPTEDFEDVWIGERSAQWLRQRPDDYPFHLFVSFVGPHDPFDPPAEYAELFREADMPERIKDTGEGKPPSIQQRMELLDGSSEEELVNIRRQYCASIKAIDEAVGTIMDALAERNDSDNTYIIFSSDHGEMLGDHNCGTKGCAYESSWRVPLFITGPGLPQGNTSEALVELMDVGETICDLAGLQSPDNIDARNFLPVVRGEEEKHRDYVVCSRYNYRAIRTSEWKYIENRNEIPELYNMTDDPEELNNLAPSSPETVGEMSRLIGEGFFQRKWHF